MRLVVIASLAMLVACASNPAPSTGRPEEQTVRVSGVTGGISGSTGLRLTSNTISRVDTLWTSFDRVWRELPAVFAVLEIPIEKFDASTNVIGHSAFKVYRRLGKFPLTRYLDCGSTQIGPNAESYEVMLTVLTRIERVRSDTSLTAVGTTVEAVAKPVQFRGDYSRCSSKGTLENRVMEILKIQLAP